MYTHTFTHIQSLDPDLEAELGKIQDTAPRYNLWTKMKVKGM